MGTQLHDTHLEFDIFDRLHKSLRISGKNSSALAADLGIHRNTVSNYLAGRSPVDRRTLIAWSMATGVPLEWLETGKDPHPVGPDGGLDVECAHRDSNPEPAG